MAFSFSGWMLTGAVSCIDEFLFAFSQTTVGRFVLELPCALIDSLSSDLLSLDQNRQVHLTEREFESPASSIEEFSCRSGKEEHLTSEPEAEELSPDSEQKQAEVHLVQDVASLSPKCPCPRKLLPDARHLLVETSGAGPLSSSYSAAFL